MPTIRHYLFTVACLVLICSPAVADPAVDALKQPGHVALMRHAIAPGGGDPAGFSLRDCSTQRNLSDEGREQAKATGQFLREQGIERLHVFSSQWCRCLETAKLLDFGAVSEQPFLNSFFQDWDHKEPRTAALRQWLKTEQHPGPVILVTHQVNISALTDVFASSGEIVVIKPHRDGRIEIVGSFELP